MPEQGRAKNAGTAGGNIETDAGDLLHYAAAQVSPPSPMPRNNEIVCFERSAPGSAQVKSVRIGTCAVASHAMALEATFMAAIAPTGAAALDAVAPGADILAEVQRLAHDRAKRIERDDPSPDVVAARLEMAVATMKLMAVEAKATGLGQTNENSLRATLRRQRPPLPR